MSIFRLPLIFGILGALLVTAAGIQVPPDRLEVAHRIGMTGPTLALVVLGLQLSRVDWSSVGGRIGCVAVAKLSPGQCRRCGVGLPHGRRW